MNNEFLDEYGSMCKIFHALEVIQEECTSHYPQCGGCRLYLTSCGVTSRTPNQWNLNFPVSWRAFKTDEVKE